MINLVNRLFIMINVILLLSIFFFRGPLGGEKTGILKVFYIIITICK